MDPQVFKDIELKQLDGCISGYKDRGWRLANLCASRVEDKLELLYSFCSGKELENLRVLIDNGQKVPAVSPLYPNAFFFENEAQDLYGVEFIDGILDYGGRFYSPSIVTPLNPSSQAAQDYLEGITLSATAEGSGDAPADEPCKAAVVSEAPVVSTGGGVSHV